MDEFVNRFFGSAWTDDNASENLSWVGNGLDLTNGLLTDTVEPYKGDEKTLPSGLITDGLSMFVGGDSQPVQGNTDIKSSMPSLMDGSSNSVYIDQQMRAPSTSGILKYGSPELLNVALDPANSPSAQPESGSVGGSDSETSEIQDTFRASYTVASHPQVWLPSLNKSVSSLPHDTMRDKLHDFGLQGQYLQTSDAVTGYNGFTDDYVLQSDLSALLSENGQHKLNDDYLSNLTAGDHIPLGRTANMHPQTQLSEENHITHYAVRSQISQLPYTPAVGSYNGTVKPRMRARRGQATDPHSIAERLRRERIADRMKNLQELVPNSNKTDKASMLDEIIDYVKFLQLQVKVLSMSRLGAAEAVVPLITDSQTEGSGGLFLCEPAGQGVDPFEATCNEAAFEQEVVELMESNMMRAIQFLQSKGLCLMPLALAEAIPSSKASSSCISSLEGINNGYVHPKNSQPTGLVYTATETRSKEDRIGALGSGSRKRGTVKLEEIMDRARNIKE